MKITREWLTASIKITRYKPRNQTMLNLSQKQTKLLKEWFPDLFNPVQNGIGDIKKGWESLLIGRKLTEEQASLFSSSSLYNVRSLSFKKRRRARLTEHAITLCKDLYNKVPPHPHLRLLSIIDSIDNTLIWDFYITSNNTAIIRFFYTDYYFLYIKRFGDPISFEQKPYVFNTVLGEVVETKNGEVVLQPLIDCTGKDIEECLNALLKKKQKKRVIFRKKVTVPLPKKQKPTKAVKKLGSDIMKLQKRFMNDFNTYNSKRDTPITLHEYANLCGVNLKETLSLFNYKGLPKEKK